MQETRSGSRPLDKGSGTTVPPSARDSVVCVSVLLLFAVETVKPLDGAVGKPRTSLEGYTGDVYSIAWSPNGKTLATGSDDRTVKLWDAATGKLLANLPGQTD